jgi:ABC-type uncharacterized transport system auxiliary subunit
MLEALLAGCGGAPRIYELNAVRAPAVYARRAAVRVRIPSALPALDGDRILERNASGLALLPDFSLGDRLPEVVAAKVVETLRKAHIRASSERETADVDYDLRVEIKDFAFDARSQTGKVTLAAKLVALGSGAVIASQVFSVSGAAPSSDPQAAVAALDAALRKAMLAMTTFVAAAIY